MAWQEKGYTFPFEQQPIDGLFFLDGDLLARQIGYEPLKGYKYPTIVFPSGVQCDLWESGDPDNAIVHLFGEMDLPLKASRDEAFARAADIAEQVGYAVRKVGENAIEAFGDEDERIRLLFDAGTQQLLDVVPIRRGEMPRPPKPDLLDAKSREALPPLYSNEQLGLDALAQVKFFTPDANWTWYASEFDGEDVFFGLVNGEELELGYFSLSELTAVHGPLGLPIERDRFFEPTSLKDLQTKHRNERTIGGAGGGGPESDPAAEILAHKDDLLAHFQALPAEHQATIGLVVTQTILKGEWGTWFTTALKTHLMRGEHSFPLGRTVTREDLQQTRLTPEEIARLSDTDLTTITRQIIEHFLTDAFWDELEFAADLVLSGTPPAAADGTVSKIPKAEPPRSTPDVSVPISWVSKDDLLAARPDLSELIAALTPAQLEHLARKVGDALQEPYHLAIAAALEEYGKTITSS